MKRILTLCIAVAMVLALVGCSQPATGPETSTSIAETSTAPANETSQSSETATSNVVRGGTITIGKTADVATMNFITETHADIDFLKQMFEPLVGIDSSGNFIPKLATSWDVAADNLSIVFHLRQGVKFHDDTDFNADAVKKNLDYKMDPMNNYVWFASDLDTIKSVDVIDTNTVKINLTQPDSALFSVLTYLSGYMISPASLEQGADYLNTHAVGTGPFMLSEFVPGDHITMVANPNYYEMDADGKPLPYLDKIIYRIMKDDSVKTANLQSGDIDAVDYNLTVNSTKQLQDMEGITTIMSPYAQTYFVAFNQNDPMLSNVKVRQAISYAVNRDELMDTVFEGLALVEPFDALPEQWFYSDYTPYKYDPDKAKQLLSEAGYPNGIDVTISNIAREPDNTIVQLLQQQLIASNINLNIDTLDRNAWIDLIKTNRGGQLATGVVGIQWLDPTWQYDGLLSYVDPKYTTDLRNLLNSSKNTFDQTQRKAILAQFQKQYLDKAIYAILGSKQRNISYNSNKVQDIAVFPSGDIDLKNVWIKP